MSTTIDVYPATDFLPLVEQTRTRTQELFQELLDRYEVGSEIAVKAFYPGKEGEPTQYLAADVRWHPGLDIGFAYWINGVWDSSSWPECCAVEPDDFVTLEDATGSFACDPADVGKRRIFDEFERVLLPERLEAVLAQDHYWFEYRNLGGAAVASTGYGLVAAALAEATGGIIASFDSAFEIEHNGEDAATFLTWWGDEQIGFYGTERFAEARPRFPAE